VLVAQRKVDDQEQWDRKVVLVSGNRASWCAYRAKITWRRPQPRAVCPHRITGKKKIGYIGQITNNFLVRTPSYRPEVPSVFRSSTLYAANGYDSRRVVAGIKSHGNKNVAGVDMRSRMISTISSKPGCISFPERLSL